MGVDVADAGLISNKCRPLNRTVVSRIVKACARIDHHRMPVRGSSSDTSFDEVSPDASEHQNRSFAVRHSDALAAGGGRIATVPRTRGRQPVSERTIQDSNPKTATAPESCPS